MPNEDVFIVEVVDFNPCLLVEVVILTGRVNKTNGGKAEVFH